MGTPEFAVPSLDILLENGYQVVGVITATDKMGGRGNKQLLQSAVKKYALQKGLRVLQPKNLKNWEFIEQLRALDANLQVVVAFRMLPAVVWEMPQYGTFNLHGSLLPKYRGAAPINWAVIKGEKETGVTTFFIQQSIDTGDILFQEKMPIGIHDTAGDVHDKMMELGATTVLKTVHAIEQQDYTLQKQIHHQATKAPKIFHDTCQIDFNQTSLQVYNFIRGLSPYPTAWTTLEHKKLKIFFATATIAPHQHSPGKLLTDYQTYLRWATTDGYIEVIDLQWQGKKRMKIKNFLNGYKKS